MPVVFLAAAQLADAATFALAILSGVPIEAEVNPLARWLFATGGLALVLTAKLFAVSMVCWSLRSFRYRPQIVLASPLIFLGWLGAFSNVGALLTTMR